MPHDRDERLREEQTCTDERLREEQSCTDERLREEQSCTDGRLREERSGTTEQADAAKGMPPEKNHGIGSILPIDAECG
jgi:hypothetical protein